MDLDKLVERHAHLARVIAYSYWRGAPHALEREELESIANLALVLAAERWPVYCAEKGFDPSRTEYFEPFAVRRMRGAIVDSLRQQDHATRSQRSRVKDLQAAGMDAGASEAELSARTGFTAAEIRDARAAHHYRPVSLDTPLTDSEVAEYHPTTTVEGDAFVSSLLLVVVDTVASLSSAHQVVLALHYYAAVELREVARLLEITESRASHLHTEAVLAVQEALRLAALDKAV